MPTARRRLTDSVNGRLLDKAVRRSIYVQRFGSHVVQNVVGFLNESVFPDLLGILTARLERIRLRGHDSGFETTKRYVGLLGDTASLIEDGADEARKLLARDARELAKLESRNAQKELQESAPLVTFKGLDLRSVQQVVEQGIQGRTMEAWFDSLATDTQKRLEEAIGIGMAQGETVDQMVQRVRGTRANDFEDGVLQVTRRQAESIVRTSVNHVSTQAREQTYEENSDVIKGVQWVSTLDSRTTPICQSRDGEVFPIGEGPRPPAHWGCRSTTVPVTKSWRELGIRAKDADESTRASMDGQVAESITYGDWLEQQPAAVQDDALGVGKARLFRAGEIEVQDLATARGRALTLAELQRL